MLHDLRSEAPPGKRIVGFDIDTPKNI